MVNFGPLAAEIGPVVWVWGTPANFNGFRILAALGQLHGTNGRQPNFAALNKGRHLYSAGRPSCWALAHISSSSSALPHIAHANHYFLSTHPYFSINPIVLPFVTLKTALPGRSIAMSVSVSLSLRSHISKNTRLNFTKFSVRVAVALSSSDDSAMFYVFPVLWMTSCLYP